MPTPAASFPASSNSPPTSSSATAKPIPNSPPSTPPSTQLETRDQRASRQGRIRPLPLHRRHRALGQLSRTRTPSAATASCESFQITSLPRSRRSRPGLLAQIRQLSHNFHHRPSASASATASSSTPACKELEQRSPSSHAPGKQHPLFPAPSCWNPPPPSRSQRLTTGHCFRRKTPIRTANQRTDRTLSHHPPTFVDPSTQPSSTVNPTFVDPSTQPSSTRQPNLRRPVNPTFVDPSTQPSSS